MASKKRVPRLNMAQMRYLDTIAKLYGAKVIFTLGPEEGSYDTHGTITMSICGEFNRVISVFCHELGHHQNRLTGKFPLLHNQKTLSRLVEILGSTDKAIEYGVKAEIYTEKVGKQICKDWFPEIKFIAFYKDNAYSRGFFAGWMGY